MTLFRMFPILCPRRSLSIIFWLTGLEDRGLMLGCFPVVSPPSVFKPGKSKYYSKHLPWKFKPNINIVLDMFFHAFSLGIYFLNLSSFNYMPIWECILQYKLWKKIYFTLQAVSVCTSITWNELIWKQLEDTDYV